MKNVADTSADSAHVYAVIMAGGSGTRFWPISRGAAPKQLVRIVGDATMIQATVARLQPYIPAERVLIVTTAALAAETRRQLPALKPEHVIAEPVGRDTAACVALAALVINRIDPQGTMILLPADQVITPTTDFQAALAVGVASAQAGNLVTFGIQPRFAATGYGYIEVGAPLSSTAGISVNQVARFVEKPDQAHAEKYLAAGTYRWNAGIFCWQAAVVIAELRQHCSWLMDALVPLEAAWGTSNWEQVFNDVYQPLKRISIDYALMEKSQRICVVTGTYLWDDVGSWDSLYDHLPADPHGVISRGPTLTIDCHDSLLMSETGQLIAGIGLSGMSVIATKDAILVVPKGRSQEVKQVVDALKAQGRGELL
jgi:mannose-1-phosphate guanylyltransferase